MFRGLEGLNNAEINKRTRVQPVPNKTEAGPQTRQLKEAGASTYSDKVVTRSDVTEGRKASNWDQTNKFKPANEVSSVDNGQEDDKINTKLESTDPDTNLDGNKKPGLLKSRSFGTSSCQLRERGPKNSTKHSSGAVQASKSVEGTNNLPADEEMLLNNGTNSSSSIIASTGEDSANKRKTEGKQNQKSYRNNTQSKTKDEKSANESSEKSESDSKENTRSKKDRAEKERVALNWIKSLGKLESELNMEPEQNPSDEEVPEFCSNKTCPISEHKIPKTPKVLRQAKKIVLRKTLFENNDERWYWLKCLKAHNESLFCYYCGQIYFMEETDLEDDGKAWICCDDCNKWVSLTNLGCFIKSLISYHFYIDPSWLRHCQGKEHWASEELQRRKLPLLMSRL